ncbi:Rab5-interacting [Gossypium australe]|uniref:Rab5-interacting n=1 Tax=Gossypium australe TaxID=47621 RepID=A0A5B6UHB4_9ROSI|nr:Rab5-interacting [Gossypium australe]
MFDFSVTLLSPQNEAVCDSRKWLPTVISTSETDLIRAENKEDFAQFKAKKLLQLKGTHCLLFANTCFLHV